MKNRKKIIELLKQDYSAKEIAEEIGTSLQNVYKHIRNIKQDDSIILTSEFTSKQIELITNRVIQVIKEKL